ncbi:MAG: EAL domain-containing protein, partial [Magnetococcales bacterium]|nr:EAL domain-containing protein [Magnetococcales bacterium]
DRMFIQDIDHNSESAILVDIIIGLARNLNLQVVGEGVETLEQQNYLNKRDCHMAQGYLYGKPMPAHEFENYLQTDFSPLTDCF